MDAVTTETEFWKQFAGSGSANLLTILAVGLLWGLKKVCSRKTKCKSHLHTCCLDVEVRDETKRERPNLADGSTVASV
jgi:hypothetical protein